jgi:hypothetical protein
LGLVYLDLGDVEMALAQHGHLTDQNEKDLAFQLLEKIQFKPDKHPEPRRETRQD